MQSLLNQVLSDFEEFPEAVAYILVGKAYEVGFWTDYKTRYDYSYLSEAGSQADRARRLLAWHNMEPVDTYDVTEPYVE